MRRTHPLRYLWLVLIVGACECEDSVPNDQVVVKADPEADFGSYETFRILDELSVEGLVDAGVDIGLLPDDVVINLDTATDQTRIELEAQGLNEVTDGGVADLGVFSLASSNETGGWVWECVPGYWWGYWGYYWDACAWLEPEYVEYTVGSLFVGLADPLLERVVFGGLLQGVADGSGDTEDRIRAGVHRMFEQYPD